MIIAISRSFGSFDDIDLINTAIIVYINSKYDLKIDE